MKQMKLKCFMSLKEIILQKNVLKLLNSIIKFLIKELWRKNSKN